MFWFAHAPSNIALIKYMGKKSDTNLPDNPSLSYTLDALFSTVELELQPGKEDYWEPLIIPGGMPFNLSEKAKKRFLDHLDFLKKLYQFKEGFVVRSANNFPAGSGLASSASSFAALTKCALTAICELTKKPLPSIEEQANLSRLASGSSCRSFFSPWTLWDEDAVKPMVFPWKELLHQVVLISHAEKKVPSSEAHARVKTSPYYAERPERARKNLGLLIHALDVEDWKAACDICWEEFQDMHRLFATAAEPFSYMTENSKQVLQMTRDFWEKEGDGPLVTMDAGPNIHLLYRPDQQDLARKFKREHLIGNYDVL